MRSEIPCGDGRFSMVWERQIGTVFQPIMTLEYKGPNTMWLQDWLLAIITQSKTAQHLALSSQLKYRPNVKFNAERPPAQHREYAKSGCQRFFLFDRRGWLPPTSQSTGPNGDYSMPCICRFCWNDCVDCLSVVNTRAIYIHNGSSLEYFVVAVVLIDHCLSKRFPAY